MLRNRNKITNSDNNDSAVLYESSPEPEATGSSKAGPPANKHFFSSAKIRLASSAVALACLVAFLFVRIEFDYAGQVEKIHRVLQGKWVYYVPEDGKLTVSVARPCGIESIKYLKENDGFLIAGFFWNDKVNFSNPYKNTHVFVADRPIKPGSLVYGNDGRVLFDTARNHADPVIVTHVFSKHGKTLFVIHDKRYDKIRLEKILL
ncbi:MAG TPA: hypothetical protein PKH33_12205 [bacterium]|nr:hypothetical protein [bacterium]